MEFIEKVRDQELEKYRIKCSSKMSSEHRAIVWGCFFGALLFLAGFTYWHLSYLYTKNETVEALRMGYEKMPRHGTSVLYWSKKNEEDRNKRSEDRRGKDSESNTIHPGSARRDASREQSEEHATIYPRPLSLSN